MISNSDKKSEKQDRQAEQQAGKDIATDPDLIEPTTSASTEDLDEGELARMDNSGEKAFDALEKPKPKSK